MTDQFDQLDRQLRSVARAARNEAAIDPTDTEQALTEVTAGAQLARLRPALPARTERRWQPWIAAAAATVLIVTGGVWLATRGDDQVRSVDPTVQSPSVNTVPDTPPSELVTAPPTVPSQTVTTSSTRAEGPFAGLPWEPTGIERVCDGPACTRLVADLDGVIYACELGAGPVVRTSDGRQLNIEQCPIAIGPGPVAYVWTSANDSNLGDGRLIAISLTDSTWGTELWRSDPFGGGDHGYVATPAGLAQFNYVPLGPQPALDRPPAFPWVLPDGQTEWPELPVVQSVPPESGQPPAYVRGDTRWELDVDVPIPPPAQATDDGGMLSAISVPETGEYTLLRGWPDGTSGSLALPTYDEVGRQAGIALLERTGTVLVPDGDTFVRIDPFPEDPSPVNNTTLPPTTTTTIAPTATGAPASADALLAGLYYEYSGVENACVADGPCTQVVIDPSGAAVSYDPTNGIITRHARDSGGPVQFAAPESDGPTRLLAAGPDQVVYTAALAGDPGSSDVDLWDVTAYSLAAGDAGREIARFPSAYGESDSDLIPGPEGLVVVGWYGPDLQPPEPYDVVFEWVDRDGAPIASQRPMVRSNFYEIAVEIGARTWTFDDPVDFAHASMPPIVPTFDGGFVAVYESVSGGWAVVRGWSDGTVDMWYPAADAGAWINLIPEPGGYVLVPHGEAFMRAELFPARPSDFWDGERSIDFEAGTMTAVGLNDYLDANEPWWETDPTGFANAVTGPLSSPAERRTIEFRDDAVVVTTENHLDDSVYGTRLTFHLVASDGGPRVDRIEWANTCQPGRGHQDYQAALCV